MTFRLRARSNNPLWGIVLRLYTPVHGEYKGHHTQKHMNPLVLATSTQPLVATLSDRGGSRILGRDGSHCSRTLDLSVASHRYIYLVHTKRVLHANLLLYKTSAQHCNIQALIQGVCQGRQDSVPGWTQLRREFYLDSFVPCVSAFCEHITRADHVSSQNLQALIQEFGQGVHGWTTSFSGTSIWHHLQA